MCSQEKYGASVERFRRGSVKMPAKQTLIGKAGRIQPQANLCVANKKPGMSAGSITSEKGGVRGRAGQADSAFTLLARRDTFLDAVFL